MTPGTRRVLAFDVGKTGCQGALYVDDVRVAFARSPGSVGIAEQHGVTAAVDVVVETRRRLGRDGADSVIVGLAGLGRARHKAPDLAAALAAQLPTDEIVLTSDMTTAHAGALGGEPGVVLSAGTGVVALGVDAAARSAVCDGWGYLLGDDGGGYAIGRAGLASALRQHDGRGGSAVLHRMAQQRYGALAGLPGLVHGATNPPREVAAFAPHVRAAAEQGDAEAVAIWDRAGRDLARCLSGAARLFGTATVTVTTTGGLFDAGPLLDGPFEVELGTLLPHARRVARRGDGLDGARLLAVERRLPHESLLLRFDGRAPVTARSGSDAALRQLETEAARPDLADLDGMSSRDMVDLISREDAGVPATVAQAGDAIAAVVDLVVDRIRAGGRLVYVGAGTSGRLAVLDAAELLPTYDVGDDVVVAVMAGGRSAVTEPAEGAEDDEIAAARDLAAVDVGAGDVVVGIAASGRTPYVLAAVEAARRVGAATAGVSNNRHTELSARVDHPIEVPTGPEVVAGSTRMKAGTAQKLVLNTLSTAVMIRLGKVYGNRMVDMRATNEKLRRRARRIVAEVTGADDEAVEEALQAADGQVKTAVVALAAHVSVDDARARLDRVAGSVRAAVDEGDAP